MALRLSKVCKAPRVRIHSINGATVPVQNRDQKQSLFTSINRIVSQL
jgi:hypothetical protein